MKNLKDLSDYISEKRIIVKRRYTEKHPAKKVSTAANVRSAVLDAIADGQLTEEEVTKILSEVSAHKRWLSRNVDLFNISEDETGVKRFSLSPYGKRIRTATTLNEALKVPHKKPGLKKVNIFVGRFQPFTLGHVKVFEKMYKENGYPVVVYLVRTKKQDPERAPFDEDLQQAMFAKMAKEYPFLETAMVVPNAGIDTLFAEARPTYEPVMWGFGTDRKKAYEGMINKPEYREDLGVDPDFKGFEIYRTDDNISASKVRNALKIDDETTFKKMTPKSIHSFYKTLQNIIQPIKESTKMKNILSLNEFASYNENSVNEAKTLDRDQMMAWFKTKGRTFVKTGEEYSKNNDDLIGSIWLSRDDDDKKFDYYSNSSGFEHGVQKSFKKQISDRGWKVSFYDPSTIFIKPA